jgi:formylglycine-generating enzyme required for sulfatase activity
MPSPRLFISHSSQDVVWCRPFVIALRAANCTCFYDEDSIPGTVEWLQLIQQELIACDLFVLVLTPIAWESVWVQRELALALTMNKPILVIQHEATPEAKGFITLHQWVNVLGMDGAAAAHYALSRLPADVTRPGDVLPRPVTPPPPVNDWESIGILSRLARLGFQGWRVRKTGVEFIVPPTCAVPGGVFTMGSDKTQDPQVDDSECPQYDIAVGTFAIGTYPVTVAEYGYAVKAKAVREPPEILGVTWAKQQENPDHPVVCVSWLDVLAYAAWLAKTTGQPWRLPTEAEWEKAARWDTTVTPAHARIYPWGDQWDRARANTNDGGPGTTTPVGAYADKGDASPYGAHDMAGNVSEWTSSIWHSRPPYDARKCESDSDNFSPRVRRGGAWDYGPGYARAAFRTGSDPTVTGYYVGARLVRVGAGQLTHEPF